MPWNPLGAEQWDGRSWARWPERSSSIVLDGVARQPEVVRCRQLAEEEGASFFVVMTTCSDGDLHRSRIEGRQRGIPDWYELDWPHVESVMASWEPLEGADLVLDASDPLAANIASLTTALEDARMRSASVT
jgi:hypothetical protein